MARSKSRADGGDASIRVRKLNIDGTLALEYAGVLVERSARAMCLRARWERPPLQLGYITFETGDVFTEWFFSDRWFNIFEVRAARDAEIKGWYCNVTTPAHLLADRVESRDLLLDLWVAPDGECLVLDEEEFAACEVLDGATRDAARRGLRSLWRAARLGAGPFRALRRQLRNDGVRI